MKIYYLFAFALLSLIACKDDDDPVSGYPISYMLHHIDQNDEGLYVMDQNEMLVDLSTDIGLYGAFKDSLKMELQEAVVANLSLDEIEIIDENTLHLHYMFQGHELTTPIEYVNVNGDIVFNDTVQAGALLYDLPNEQFILCGVTPFAFPGPNAGNPLAPPYLQFLINNCKEGFVNKDYAEELVNTQPLLQPLDTIAVLFTKFIFRK